MHVVSNGKSRWHAFRTQPGGSGGSAGPPPVEPPTTVPTDERRTVGGTDLRVFPLAIGGSVFGWTASADDTVRILDRYAAAGGNFIDTADSYSGGRSEVQIGRWIAARRNRDAIVLATKVGRHPDAPGLSRQSVMRAVDASLQRLGVDGVDLLYLHGEDSTVLLEETLGAVRDLMDAGKVRYLGASDVSAEWLTQARILAAAGYPRVHALETEYSLVSRTAFEATKRMVASAQGISVMPYFALANGFLTGKYRTRAQARGDTRESRAAQYFSRRGMRVLRALNGIARERDAAVATVALAWLGGRPSVCAPVVGASSPEHVDDLMASTSLELSGEQRRMLDRASRG